MSVTATIASLARENTHPAVAHLQVHRAQLPALRRILEAGLEALLLLGVADGKPVLDQRDAAAYEHPLELRHERAVPDAADGGDGAGVEQPAGVPDGGVLPPASLWCTRPSMLWQALARVHNASSSASSGSSVGIDATVATRRCVG
jgi:hypothetical protein